MAAPMDVDDSNVVYLPQATLPSLWSQDDYTPHLDQQTPLIIDNGTTNLRWGWSTSDKPYHGVNIISKYKERRSNKPLVVFGEAVDLDSTAKAQAKTAWEGDILINFDALENALDHVFIQLGIQGDRVNHPIVMTERLCSLLHSRALTSEILFEQYRVPSICYCVDGIMSFYQNNAPAPDVPFTTDGLVLSFNTASTSIMPILRGKGILSSSKRIPWGASQASDYLLKLIQLKYSSFPTRVTNPQANWILRTQCSFAPSYDTLLKSLHDPRSLLSNTTIIQFPYTLPVTEEKTEEELARIAEKRKEQGLRLQKMAAEMRAKKNANKMNGINEELEAKESDLEALLSLREQREEFGSERVWLDHLRKEGFSDEAEFEEMIEDLQAEIGEMQSELPKEASFSLVNVPDGELNEEDLKEKKKQKLMKAAAEARERTKKEKERIKEEREKQLKKEEDERNEDLDGWAKRKRDQHEAIMSRIKKREKRKAALNDRKSSAAQARMKNIASLASEEKEPKKKKKGDKEDMFGVDDADWAIYRKINTAVASSDEEDDWAQLKVIEQNLLQHDPTFTKHDTLASINSRRSELLTAFRPFYDDGDIKGHSRIHLTTEKWRVCETWFSPSMAGIDCAGLGEIIQNILSGFTEAQKSRLVSNIMVTGSPSQIPGIIPRLHNTLRPLLDPDMTINVSSASDPVFDAWKGMATFAKSEYFQSGQASMTTEQYYEEGGERIKRWWGSNWNGGLQNDDYVHDYD